MFKNWYACDRQVTSALSCVQSNNGKVKKHGLSDRHNGAFYSLRSCDNV